MKCLSIDPFVPSGPDFEAAKAFFKELGFGSTWEDNDYVGFENNGCSFILQRYDQRAFAENFMLSVQVEDVATLREHIISNKLPEKYSIKVGIISEKPYGKELNIIDQAGVCWHFIQ